jgi:energy-coupling factor transporter ATP-binding protein EcfA2
LSPGVQRRNEMNEEYGKFLATLRGVSKYSFDTTLSESGEDELQRPFTLSHEEFLKELYEEREVENTIKKAILTSTELICLVGPRGCGKSSLGLKITNDLSHSRSFNQFVVFLDIRTEEVLHVLSKKSPEVMKEFLDRRIEAEYRSRLFPYNSSVEHNPQVLLWAFLLARKDENVMPRKTFYRFYSMQDRAAIMLRRYKAIHPEERKDLTLYDWLDETHIRDSEVLKLLQELDSITLPTDLVYAARHIYGYSRHVVWVDNIDAIQDVLQAEAVKALKGFLRTALSYACCVVAVREENVYREEELGERGGPPFDTRIIVTTVRDRAGHVYYPAYDVPLIDIKTLGNIFKKRMEYTKKYQERMIEKTKSEIEQLNKQLKGSSNDKEKTQIQQAINERTEMELSYYSPGISNKRSEYLTSLSRKILTTMDNERASLMANNSIRDLLFMHRDFLGFLLRSPDEDREPPQALEYEEWFVATLFLRWVRNVQRKYQIGMYDILSECYTWYKMKQVHTGCLLPHLIITTAWNLCLEKRSITGKRLETVRVKEVIDRLKRLAYEHDQIINCMFSLYSQPGISGNFVEFRVVKGLNDAKQIKDDYTFNITYRGKAFVSYVGSSFGYFTECLRNFINPTGDVLTHAPILTTEQQAIQLLPYLCDIAQMHYKEFKRIVKRGSLGDKETTLNNYLLYFGVPQEEPYKGKVTIGTQFHGIRRAFHFDNILSCILGYVRAGKISQDIETLQRLFLDAMNNVSKLENIDPDREEINFRIALGVRPREE